MFAKKPLDVESAAELACAVIVEFGVKNGAKNCLYCFFLVAFYALTEAGKPAVRMAIKKIRVEKPPIVQR